MEIRFEMYHFWHNVDPDIIETPVLQNNRVWKMHRDFSSAAGLSFSSGSLFPVIRDNPSLNIGLAADVLRLVSMPNLWSNRVFYT